MASEIEYSPAQVGQRLGVKPGMARRYHLAYETVTGEELRRDARTNGRMVSDGELAVLERARSMVRANPSLSVEDAIRTVLGVVTAPTEPVLPQEELLRRLVEEMQAIRQDMRQDRERMAVLEQENAALRALSLTSETDVKLEDLRKMNAHLLAELERRRLEAEKPKRRAWWKWWDE
jgi:hypothetical protein